MLTTLGAVESRAVDGELTHAGTFKLDANGNISAIGVFVNEENGRETLSNLSVVPYRVKNLTENYLFFEGCSYYDEDGDKVEDVPFELQVLLVRRSDGLIYSAVIGEERFDPYSERGAFTEDGASRLLGVFNPSLTTVCIGRITLSSFEGTFEKLTTDGAPIEYPIYPRLFAMDRGVIAISGPYLPTDQKGMRQTVSLVYPNGGYENLNNNGIVGGYILLENGIIQYAAVADEPSKFISVGSSYGQSSEEVIGTNSPNWSDYYSNPSSWYETANKVVVKTYSDWGNPNSYFVYDKQTRQFEDLPTEFDNSDNMELWNENICNGRFYGLTVHDGKPSKAVWLDPTTLTTGQTDLNIGNEIDITDYSVDYKHASAQLTGTRRSDGYKVAISVDLRTGEHNTIFSAPNREIISLIPLN